MSEYLITLAGVFGAVITIGMAFILLLWIARKVLN